MKAPLSITFALLAGCATVSASPTAERNGVLSDPQGKTLYVFKKDQPNVSTCYDGCAKAWPPFTACSSDKAGGDLTLVPRKDGAQQWAYKGQPLYYYAGNTAAGDMSGEGSGKVWYVIRLGSTGAAPAASRGYTY